MMTERELLNAIFQTALKGCEADVMARKDAIWNAACTLLADVLRESDFFTRERLLKGLVAELRGSIDRLSELLPPPGNNRWLQ